MWLLMASVLSGRARQHIGQLALVASPTWSASPVPAAALRLASTGVTESAAVVTAGTLLWLGVTSALALRVAGMALGRPLPAEGVSKAPVPRRPAFGVNHAGSALGALTGSPGLLPLPRAARLLSQSDASGASPGGLPRFLRA